MFYVAFLNNLGARIKAITYGNGKKMHLSLREY